MKKICVKVQRNKILLNISLVLVVRTNFYLVKLAWFFKAQFNSLNIGDVHQLSNSNICVLFLNFTR